MDERSKAFSFYCGDGVFDFLADAKDRVRKAEEWAATWVPSEVETEGMSPQEVLVYHHTEYERINLAVAEMRASLMNCIVNLVMMAGSLGSLSVYRDGDTMLYWRNEATGYHGGVVYHAAWTSSQDRAPYGTWSIHT